MLVDLYDRIASHALLAGVSCYFGGEALDANKGAPSLVCVPTTDDWRRGKVELDGYDRSKRAVGTLTVGATFRLWAVASSQQAASSKQHHAAAEELLRKFLVVLHREFTGVHEVASISWLGQDGSALAHLGRAVDVSVRFLQPVYELPAETGVAPKVVTDTEPTVRFDFPPAGPSANDETVG